MATNLAIDNQLIEEAKSIGKHKKRDPKEISEAEEVAREELEFYGYL